MAATFCRPGKWHQFDTISGYCVHGCGNREDGRIVSREGNVIAPGPEHTDAELAEIRRRADTRNAVR